MYIYICIYYIYNVPGILLFRAAVNREYRDDNDNIDDNIGDDNDDNDDNNEIHT
jgi:hypothetical protein